MTFHAVLACLSFHKVCSKTPHIIVFSSVVIADFVSSDHVGFCNTVSGGGGLLSDISLRLLHG